MSKINGMSWRAITRKQAEYVGMAASVAGGFVAVEGDGLARVATEKLPPNADDYDYDCLRQFHDEMAENNAVEIQGGDCAFIGGEYLVMCVPADAGLADMGWSIPAKLVDQWLAKNPKYATEPAAE